MTEYIAVDIGKKKCVTCVMDQNGLISEYASYRNTSFDAYVYAKHAVEKYGDCKAVIEATGNMWVKTYEAFESNGVEVKLANPVKTRAIAEARIKTDKLDAKILAHLLRADLIAECYIPSKNVREIRALLGQRVNLSKEENRVKNRIHSLLDKYDLKCEYGDIFGAHGMRWLLGLELDGNDDEVLQSLIRQLMFILGEEKQLNKAVARYGVNDRYVPLIMSMPGFDYYGATLLAVRIADVSRFLSPPHLISWAGICPSVHQTGATLYHGKMKGGDKKVQWIMTQAANIAVMHDSRFKAYYEKKLRRGHHHNVAITHVANKMLTILWHMLTENRLYNERKEPRYQSKLKKLAKIAS